MTRESDFQAVVIDVARFNGWRVFHLHDARRQVRPGVLVGDRDAAGFPDLVLVRDTVLYRELKTEKGRLTPGQESWLAALRRARADVDVWRPRDWPRIEAELCRRPEESR